MGLGEVDARARTAWRACITLRPHLNLAAAALLAALACSGPDEGLEGPELTPLQQAQQATAMRDWPTAAYLWSELALSGGEGWDEACLNAAEAFRASGDLESAEGVLELGLRKDPQNADMHEKLGEVLLAMGFRRAAEGSFESALELDPDRHASRLNLARLRLDLGLEASALVALDEAVERGSACSETWYLRATACRQRGDVEGAYDGYRRSFDMEDPGERRLLRASTLYLDPRVRGRDDRARYLTVTWLRLVVDQDPQCSEAWYILGCVQDDGGAHERALESFDRAVETDPTDLDYLEALARTCAVVGNDERAVEMVDRAMALGPGRVRAERLRRLVDDAQARAQ